MRVGALVAPRGGGRGESRLRELWKETITVGRCGTYRGCGKDSRGGEREKRWVRRREWVRIELILFHGPASTSLYCRPDRAARSHPFCFSNPALFIYRPSYIMGTRKRRHVLLRYSAPTHVDSLALLVHLRGHFAIEDMSFDRERRYRCHKDNCEREFLIGIPRETRPVGSAGSMLKRAITIHPASLMRNIVRN